MFLLFLIAVYPVTGCVYIVMKLAILFRRPGLATWADDMFERVMDWLISTSHDIYQAEVRGQRSR